ncbi:MAG: hypothetical protein MZV65_07080 [Chromatiales bacterium]|nr:hypothetical protein [Chromatiales bacterium]
MYKKQSLSLAVALCLSTGLGQAFAAESLAQIKSLKGDAMVTQGERFVTAHEGMTLQQLDRVAVLEQGLATIEFADGCQYEMKEMELLTVGSKSVCEAKGSEHQRVRQTAISQVEPGAGGTGTGTGATGNNAGPDLDITGGAIVGGLAVVGVVAALSSSGDGDDSPLPPPISPQ